MLGEAGIVTAAIVIVAWILNQGLSLVGVSISTDWKKGIVLAVAVGLAVAQDPFELGSPSLEPDYLAFLGGQAVAMFKAAQIIYDQVFQRLLKA